MQPWDEIGDRIFRRRYPELDQNIGAIVTDDGLVVIDSRSHPHHARILRGDLTRLSPLPVRWLINTHEHWDHTFGNQLFPEAVIVGHTNCRRGLLSAGPELVAELKQADWFQEEERHHFDEVEIVPPTLVFDGETRLWAGGREFRLSYHGRGHTDGDIVIFIDDVMFAGDLVEEGGPPNFGDSYPREWVDTLRVVADLVTGPVVPGHGDVVDRAHVVWQAYDIGAAIAGEPSSITGPHLDTLRSRL